MRRIAIDNMIADRIMERPGLLRAIRRAAGCGALVIVATHILRDGLAQTSDPERRRRLLATCDELPKEEVPTRGLVLDVSQLDEARLGDGAESGVSLGQLKTRGRGAWKDALIATTASGDADVLVTEDKDLAKRVRAARARCAVWNFAEFARFVQAESAGCDLWCRLRGWVKDFGLWRRGWRRDGRKKEG